MTISYPITLPSIKSFETFSLFPSSQQSRSRSSFSGKEQIYQHSGEFWILNANYPALTPSEEKEIGAALTSLRGGVGTFLWGDPLAKTPKGVGTGTPVVSGAGQTGTSLVTGGWTINQTGILKAGDYLSVDSYLYRVLQDANSNGSGVATFDIFPRLRTSPANGATITVSSPKGLFRLDENGFASSASTEGLYRIGFNAVEAI